MSLPKSFDDACFESVIRAKVYQPATHRKWLNENCVGRYACVGRMYFFDRNEDAVLFALVWG